MLGLISAMPKSYIIKLNTEAKLRNSLTAIGPIPDTIVIGKNKPGAEAVELY